MKKIEIDGIEGWYYVEDDTLIYSCDDYADDVVLLDNHKAHYQLQAFLHHYTNKSCLAYDSHDIQTYSLFPFHTPFWLYLLYIIIFNSIKNPLPSLIHTSVIIYDTNLCLLIGVLLLLGFSLLLYYKSSIVFLLQLYL